MVSFMKAKSKKSGKNRLQKRAKRTRKKLKEAALDVFSEKSVDAATVEEITEKAELGKREIKGVRFSLTTTLSH